MGTGTFKQGLGSGGFIVYTNADQVIAAVTLLQTQFALNWKKIVSNAMYQTVVKRARQNARMLISTYTRKMPRAYKRTGKLVDNIKVKVKKAKMWDLEMEIGSYVGYSVYFEKGTGLYGPKKSVILFRGGKGIWFNGKNNHWYFMRKSVGVPPRPFLVPAVIEKWEDFLTKVMTDTLKKLYKAAALGNVVMR